MLLWVSKAASFAPSLTFQYFFIKRKMRVGYIPVMIGDYRVRNWTFWKAILVKSSKKKKKN